jgi:hypothetical protein
MKKKPKVIEINFNPQNKLTSARAHEIAREQKQKLIRLYLEKKFEESPGPNCLSDVQIKSYGWVEARFYNTPKGQKMYNHLFSCDRCHIRSYFLMGETAKEYLGLS